MSELKSAIAKVADGTPLSTEEAKQAFDTMMSGNATPSQIGGFLMALRVRGETVGEITGAVSTMREKMLRAGRSSPMTRVTRGPIHIIALIAETNPMQMSAPTIRPPVSPKTCLPTTSATSTSPAILATGVE